MFIFVCVLHAFDFDCADVPDNDADAAAADDDVDDDVGDDDDESKSFRFDVRVCIVFGVLVG